MQLDAFLSGFQSATPPARGDTGAPLHSVSKKARGGNVTRPRAADDFPAIRARLEELRRERAAADDDPRLAAEPRPYGPPSRPELARKTDLSRVIRRLLPG